MDSFLMRQPRDDPNQGHIHVSQVEAAPQIFSSGPLALCGIGHGVLDREEAVRARIPDVGVNAIHNAVQLAQVGRNAGVPADLGQGERKGCGSFVAGVGGTVG